MVIRIRVNLSGPAAVGGGVSTFHFSEGGGAPQACADAVQDFWDGFITAFSTSLSFQVDSQASTFNTFTGALTAVDSLTVEPLKTGTGAGDPLPPATQGLLRLRTSSIVGNRILAGKLFIPGWRESQSDSPGRPSSGVKTLMIAQANALIADPSAEWAVWHRPVAGSGGSVGVVTAATAWDEWAVLRSRRD